MFDKESIVDGIRGGAGTSANMNIMNEVIANRAIEMLCGKKGLTRKHVAPSLLQFPFRQFIVKPCRLQIFRILVMLPVKFHLQGQNFQMQINDLKIHHLWFDYFNDTPERFILVRFPATPDSSGNNPKKVQHPSDYPHRAVRLPAFKSFVVIAWILQILVRYITDHLLKEKR